MPFLTVDPNAYDTVVAKKISEYDKEAKQFTGNIEKLLHVINTVFKPSDALARLTFSSPVKPENIKFAHSTLQELNKHTLHLAKSTQTLSSEFTKLKPLLANCINSIDKFLGECDADLAKGHHDKLQQLRNAVALEKSKINETHDQTVKIYLEFNSNCMSKIKNSMEFLKAQYAAYPALSKPKPTAAATKDAKSQPTSNKTSTLFQAAATPTAAPSATPATVKSPVSPSPQGKHSG